MAALPRRLNPSPDERLKVNLDRMAPGSATGFTRSARPVNPLTGSQARLPQRPSATGNYVPLGTTWADSMPAGAVPAGATSRVDAENGVAVGPDSLATSESGVAVGCEATALGMRSVAVGFGAVTGGTDGFTGDNATALGPGSRAAPEGSTAIGYNANVSFPYDIAIGTDQNTLNINTLLRTSAGAASGEYLPIRCGDGAIRLLLLYSLP